MGADQIAAIRPALQEIDDAVAAGEPNAAGLCVTFNVAGDEDAWVQVMDGVVNAGYRRQEDPDTFLQAAGIPRLPGLKLSGWDEETFATWNHAPCTTDEVAKFVDQLLAALHSLDPETYEVDWKIENLED